jgi:hypothetical protein
MRAIPGRYVLASIAAPFLAAILLLTGSPQASAAQSVGQGCSAFKPCGDGLHCMPFRQVCHRDSGARDGEACQAGYGCAGGFTCEAGSQVCRGPGKVGDSCHATKPCGSGLSCAPGSQKCYHSPRQEGEPCVAGYPCGGNLTCEAGSQVCRKPGNVGDACHATRPCGSGLSCQPGVQKCYHSPRTVGEPCVAGYGCGTGLSCAAGSQVCYANAPSPPYANGAARRPFYIVGHNPNTMEEVRGDLDAGGNALEPDIMKFSDKAQYNAGKAINDSKGKSGLFVYHDSVLVTTRMPMTVESYFAEVAKLIAAGRNVALITVDVKSPVYGSGAELVTAVHEAFQSLPAASKPWIIYNTGDDNGASDTFFTAIAGMLTEREGMMIDGTQDPVAVYNKLQGKSRNGNIGYGTGGQGITSGSFPKVDLSIDLSTWIRASQGLKASVPYVFPIPSAASAAGVDWFGSFMDSGVDGLIPDLDLNPAAPASTQAQIKALKSKLDGRSDYFLATAKDNPFTNGQEGYALRVDTSSATAAGTDGYVTFTLRGAKGSSSWRFNGRTSLGSATRFHSGGRDYLVIPSKDLGKLVDLTIYVSGAVLHSWDVKQIQITSARYGIPYQNQPDIAINKTVSTTSPVVVNLSGSNLGR